MPADTAIRVEGLGELQRAFALADREVSKRLRGALMDAAEPVRSDAETLASDRIPRIGIPWSRMRVGVTRHSVYVAPRKRGTRRAGGSRPNLAGLMLERAMVPALEANRAKVVNEIDDMLGDVARLWGRGG